MGEPWTEIERGILRHLWPTERVAVIAARLGRNRNSIIGAAHRMGLCNKQTGFPLGQGRPERRLSIMDKIPSKEISVQPVGSDEPVPLLKAQCYHCRAVVDQRGSDGLAMFCGKPIVGGQAFSFCSDHLKLYTTRGYAR